MRTLLTRAAAWRRAAAESEDGTAAIEYTLVAAGMAVAFTYALWLIGPEIELQMARIESTLIGGDVVVSSSERPHFDQNAAVVLSEDYAADPISTASIDKPEKAVKKPQPKVNIELDAAGRLTLISPDGSGRQTLDMDMVGTIKP